METQTTHPFTRDAIIFRIKNEVLALMEEQTEAIQAAAFVGMTWSEAKRCDERREKIVALVDQLMRKEERR